MKYGTLAAYVLCAASLIARELPFHADAELGFDSRHMKYGRVENDEPVFRLEGEVECLDLIHAGVESVYGLDSRGRNLELSPSAGIGHTLTPDDSRWIPTDIALDATYLYERCAREDDGQFWTFGIGLPALMLEPAFVWEKETARDGGNYLALEIGHTFELTARTGIRLSAWEGWGDGRRNERGAGLMDTRLKVTFDYAITEHLALGADAAYCDYFTGADERTWLGGAYLKCGL